MASRQAGDTIARTTILLGALVASSNLFGLIPDWPSGWIGACIVILGLAILPRIVSAQSDGDYSSAGSGGPIGPAGAELTNAMFATFPAAPIEQLFKEALESKTPDSLIESVSFVAQFRRFAPFNAGLIRVQRRGARAVASESEWECVGRTVAPDAIPILILKPFGPITWVYELGDTFPAIDREGIGDPFAAKSSLNDAAIEQALQRLTYMCDKHDQFRIEIVKARLGFNFAGSASGQGNLAIELPPDAVALDHVENEQTEAGWTEIKSKSGKSRAVRLFRVKYNDRLGLAERLVTVAHELGHIFCGHLGPVGFDTKGRTGWPDRSALGHHEKEMEAEAVAWLVAKRARIIGGSAAYLKRHVQEGDQLKVDPTAVNRAAGLIEKLAGLDYALKSPSLSISNNSGQPLGIQPAQG